MKLNRPEAARATGLAVETPEQFAAAAQRLLETLSLEAVVLTLDKHGAYVASRSGDQRLLQTRPRHVYDVTGAGDMAFAMLAAARAAGANWEEATALANVAGGLEVEKFGVVPITPQEIIHELLAERTCTPGSDGLWRTCCRNWQDIGPAANESSSPTGASI